MEYSLEFSQRLIEAARSFVGREKTEDETARAVLYLSVLSCEISLKALLEQAGYKVKYLRKRSHDIAGLTEDLCFCDLIGTGIPGYPLSAAELLSQVVDPTFANATVGTFLDFEESGGSKYPNEIRYCGDESPRSYSPLHMLKCAEIVCQWAKDNLSKIQISARRPPTTERMVAKFEVYKLTEGFRWRLRASSGEIVASSESFETMAGAKEGAVAAKSAAATAAIVEI